jgi:hypothetical protein
VSDYDEPVATLVEPELHPARAKLLVAGGIKGGNGGRFVNRRTFVWKTLEDLLDRAAERKNLLLLKPNDMGIAVDDCQQPETPLARLADGFNG